MWKKISSLLLLTLLFHYPAYAQEDAFYLDYKLDALLDGGVDRLLLGEVTQAEPAEVPPVKGPDYALILNIVIFLIAILLGGLILLRLRKKDLN